MQTDRQTNRRKYTDVKFAPQKTFWLRGGGGRGSLLGVKVRNSRREILVLLSLVRRHLGNKGLWETDGGVRVRRGGAGGGRRGGLLLWSSLSSYMSVHSSYLCYNVFLLNKPW